MAKESQPSQTTGQVVRVEAQPSRISLELGRRAVLVIDMQNDFGAKGGMFDLLGINLSMIHGAVGYRPLVGLRSKTSLYRYDALLTSAGKSGRLACKKRVRRDALLTSADVALRAVKPTLTVRGVKKLNKRPEFFRHRPLVGLRSKTSLHRYQAKAWAKLSWPFGPCPFRTENHPKLPFYSRHSAEG